MKITLFTLASKPAKLQGVFIIRDWYSQCCHRNSINTSLSSLRPSRGYVPACRGSPCRHNCGQHNSRSIFTGRAGRSESGSGVASKLDVQSIRSVLESACGEPFEALRPGSVEFVGAFPSSVPISVTLGIFLSSFRWTFMIWRPAYFLPSSRLYSGLSLPPSGLERYRRYR